MTYLDLQTEIRQNIIDLPTTVTNRVPTLVKRAITALQNRHNFKVMETEQEYITTVSTRSIGAQPTNFKEWRLFPSHLENEGGWQKMYLTQNISEIRQAKIEEDDLGFPIFLIPSDATDINGSATMDVYPLPDGNSDYNDGEYRIFVPYIKYLPDLSANDDSNWFTVNASEYIINYATGLGFLADWDEAHSAVWMQLAENKFKEVVQRDKVLRLSHVTELVPYRDVNEAKLRI